MAERNNTETCAQGPTTDRNERNARNAILTSPPAALAGPFFRFIRRVVSSYTSSAVNRSRSLATSIARVCRRHGEAHGEREVKLKLFFPSNLPHRLTASRSSTSQEEHPGAPKKSNRAQTASVQVCGVPQHVEAKQSPTAGAGGAVASRISLTDRPGWTLGSLA